MKKLLIIIIALSLCYGCNQNVLDMFNSPSTKIKNSADDIERVSEGIKIKIEDQANHVSALDKNNEDMKLNDQTIKEKAEDIQLKAKDNSDSSIILNAKDIANLADSNIDLATKNKMLLEKVLDSAVVLGQYSTELNNANIKIKEAGKDTDKLVKRIVELEDKNKTLLHAKLVWLIIIGIIVTAIGAALLFRPETSNLGRVLGIVGFLVSLIALGITYYAENLAMVSGIVIIFILGYLIYTIYNERMNAKIMDETATIINTAKRELPNLEEKRIFGKDGKPGYVTDFQSPATAKFLKSHNKGFYK